MVEEPKKAFSNAQNYKNTKNEVESSKKILGPMTVFKNSVKPGEGVQKSERFGQFQKVEDFSIERRNPDLKNYPQRINYGRE